jgi:5S rRNA maturation endonuclease (ribonuclease M5)
LSSLLAKLFAVSGKYPFGAAKILQNYESIIPTDADVSPLDIWDEAADNFHKRESRLLPKHELRRIFGKVYDQYPLLQTSDSIYAGRCRYYLSEKRGIAPWVYNFYRVRCSAKSNLLAFPLTDAAGNVYHLRARKINAKKMWTLTQEHLGIVPNKIKETGAWFGLHTASWDSAAILVEGEIDAMRLVTLGYFNVFASSTSSVTHEQLGKIKSNVICLGYDNDKSGRRANDKAREYFRGKKDIFEIDWGVENVKDAGDLKSKASANNVFNRLKYIY